MVARDRSGKYTLTAKGHPKAFSERSCFHEHVKSLPIHDAFSFFCLACEYRSALIRILKQLPNLSCNQNSGLRKVYPNSIEHIQLSHLVHSLLTRTSVYRSYPLPICMCHLMNAGIKPKWSEYF